MTNLAVMCQRGWAMVEVKDHRCFADRTTRKPCARCQRTSILPLATRDSVDRCDPADPTDSTSGNGVWLGPLFVASIVFWGFVVAVIVRMCRWE